MLSKTLFATTAIALVAIFSSNSALAQSSPAPDVEAIVVTGSLLGRSDLRSPSPISVVSGQQILEAGTLNITDVLKQDPSLGVQSRSNTNTLSGAGASNVNMRNLGSRRTLALVNGRRLPLFTDPIGNGSQDTTVVPSNLIQRVDVLRDGASTTYGADAVAGVVNFILRDRFDGAQTEAYYGISDENDARAYRLSGLFGKTWDRGSIVVSGIYQDQDPVKLSQRKWTQPAIQTLALPAGPNTTGSNNTPGGAVLSTTGAQLACYPFTVGAIPQADPNCPRFNSADETSLIGGVSLRNIGMIARYDLTENIRFSADVFQSHRESFNEITATQILTSGQTGSYAAGFRVSAASTNNPFGQDVNIRWRPSTYGSRPTIAKVNLTYVNLGLDGDLFDGRLNWKLSHNSAQSESQQRVLNQINSVAVFNLFNTQACAADRVCAPIGPIANIPNTLSGRTPLTTAQQNYLFFTQMSQNEFVSEQTIAQVSGSLFTLPAGDVGLAVGYEHRKETGSVIPDATTQSGVGIGIFVFPTDGRFTTDEVFGELNVPLLADQPLAKELTVNLQGRYSDFSNFGKAKTYKVGVNYSPVDSVRFRGALGTSFRAPDVTELYGGGVGATVTITDACNSGAGTLRANNAQVNANCVRLGVPSTFFQAATALPSRQGGNPALSPERGRTITFGVVLQPSFLPDFSATIDAYDIRIRNAIGGGNTQLNLNNCYGDANLTTRSANEADVCFGLADRQVNGQLNRISVRSNNLQRQYTAGIDFSAAYKLQELGFVPGSFSADLRLSYVRSFKTQGVQLVNTINGALDGAQAYPRLRGNLTGTYSSSVFDVQWQVNFVDNVRDLNYGTTIPLINLKNYNGVPQYFSHDVLLRWRAREDTRVSVGVNNLFDKDPPYVFATSRNASSTLHDQIGRYFFVTIAKDW